MKALTTDGGVTRQQGFSLVELMVAVSLSLLLMVGVVALFVSSRTNYETTERLSRIQENGRYALDQLTSSVREGGFNGCTRPLNTYSRRRDYEITTLKDSTSLLWNFMQPVLGYNANGDGTWTPDAAELTDPDTGLDVPPHGLSDVLVLRVPSRDVIPFELNTTQITGADPLDVPPVMGGRLESGDVVMISDCDGRAYFEVTSYVDGIITHTVTPSGKNEKADLLHPFRAGAEIVPLQTVIYYVRARDPMRPMVDISLWRKIGSNVPEELAEGIERMEVTYGQDTNGDGRVDTYASAAAITNWGNVVTARVALLARSPEPYGNERDSEVYVLLDETVPAPNDRYQRQVFTTTIALRNLVID